MKRVFLIVLDSFGIGAMSDSESYGDVGVNTLLSISKSEPVKHVISSGNTIVVPSTGGKNPLTFIGITE